MATKRKITVKVPPPVESEEGKDERGQPVILRRDRGWKNWFLRDYLRYWYFVGCLMADTFVGLEIWLCVDTGLSTSVPLIAVAALVLIEFLAYISLWGKNGRWRTR
jgi:hypothetical protein